MGIFVKCLPVKGAKISILDTTSGADFFTVTTVGAFFVVDHSQVINNLNGLCRTLAFTLLAANTADFASLAGYSALLLAATANDCINRIRNNVDQMVGASLSARATSNTKFCIDASKTIVNIDRVLRTDSHTIAIAVAAERAAELTGKQ